MSSPSVARNLAAGGRCGITADGGRCPEIKGAARDARSLLTFVELEQLLIVARACALPDLAPVRVRHEDVIPKSLYQQHLALAFARRLGFSLGHHAGEILQQ